MNLANALGAGYTAQAVISQMIRAFPELASKLQMASAAGYSAEEMVKYLSKLKPKEMEKINKYRPGGENPLITGQRAAEVGGPQGQALTSAAKGLGKMALGTGGAALGAYALNRALPFIAGQLGAGNASPTTPSPSNPPGAPPIPNNMPPQAGIEGTQPLPDSPVPGGPGSPGGPGVGGPMANAAQHANLIKQLGLEAHIKRQTHLSAGDIAATVDFLLSPTQKKWLSEQTSAPIEQIVSDYLSSESSNPMQAAPIQQQPNQVQQPEGAPPIEQPKALPAEQPKVATPSAITPGIEEVPEQISKQVSSLSGKNIGSVVSVGGLPGKIENIKKDIAKVNVDGKIRHLKLKDVEEAPEDVREAVSRILNIPEIDRSAVTAYFGYSPEDRSLAVQYHNGNLYTYDNVDESKIHLMANKLGIPVTSGKNLFGEWEQGKQDSLGAALIKEIVKDPEYSKENKNKTWRKYETGYDYWEKLRQKPKPRVASSKAKQPSKKPDDDKEHGIKRKKKPKTPKE